ncbi:MAG: prepilin-type N-terminal cleavage/methylation domain-containing protein [Parcubacteria group bacterium]|nr:prepilin-type N-terminal cleavage/methylation domain-containing protein [Parcubacteria group bacterium]
MYNFFHTHIPILKTKDYGLKTNGGFTLIELLIVVAIIGILSSVIFVTISNTRPRARDARRLAEVKQMQLALALDETSSATGGIALGGCTSAYAAVSSCTSPSNIAGFNGVVDPNNYATACGNGATTECKYSISTAAEAAGAKTNNYKICFWLEDPGSSIPGVAAGSAGAAYSVSSTNQNIVAGC